MEQLEKCTHRLFDSGCISTFHMRPKAEMIVQSIKAVFFPKHAECLSQVVCNESVVCCQNVLGVLWRLPPRHVKVQPIYHSKIKLFGQRLEKVGGGILNESFNWLIKVPNEGQRSISVNLRNTAAEPAIRHVIFHDLDGVWIVDLHSPNFIKGHNVPMTD